MKKYSILLLLPFFSMLFTSCLKDGLDEGVLSTECDVTNIHFEHRWATEMTTSGMYQLNFMEMTVNKTIDTENCVIEVQITVPAVSNNYPQEQRDATTLSIMAWSFEVSRAASVAPLNGAPVLGKLGDYTKEHTYRVISASGEYKDWTVKVTSFTK